MAIQMSFRIPTILAGETKVINFIYGTNQSDLEDSSCLPLMRWHEVWKNPLMPVFNPDFRVSPNSKLEFTNLLALI